MDGLIVTSTKMWRSPYLESRKIYAASGLQTHHFFKLKYFNFMGGAGVVYTNSETNSKFAPKKWMLGNTFSFPFGAFIGPIFRGKLAEFQGV